MYFNSSWCYMVHGGNYFLPLLQYVNDFASYLFKSFYFYVHTKEYPITVWLHCRVTVSLHVVWSSDAFSLNVVCIHRSVLQSATHISAPRAPSGNGKYRHCFILTTEFAEMITWQPRYYSWVVSFLTPGPNSKRKKVTERKHNIYKLISQTQDGPSWKDSIFFCFANINLTLKQIIIQVISCRLQGGHLIIIHYKQKRCGYMIIRQIANYCCNTLQDAKTMICGRDQTRLPKQ